jgi:uncharacterized membrane protein
LHLVVLLISLLVLVLVVVMAMSVEVDGQVKVVEVVRREEGGGRGMI